MKIVNAIWKSPLAWIVLWALVGGLLAAGAVVLCIRVLSPDSEFAKLLNPFPWTVVAAVATVLALILIWYWRKSDKNRDIGNTRERLLSFPDGFSPEEHGMVKVDAEEGSR